MFSWEKATHWWQHWRGSPSALAPETCLHLLKLRLLPSLSDSVFGHYIPSQSETRRASRRHCNANPATMHSALYPKCGATKAANSTIFAIAQIRTALAVGTIIDITGDPTFGCRMQQTLWK